MFSGAALIFTILLTLPLWLTLLVTGAFAASAFATIWALSPPDRRELFAQRMRAGLIAGLVATALYDLSRWSLVEAGGLSYWPFKTFPIFGRLIAGAGLSLPQAYLVGTLYHVANGILFSIAYCLIFGRRHWGFAIAWAILLEATVLWLYPGWLGLGPIMAEFAAISLIGHVCFGLGLGFTSRRLLQTTRSTRFGS